MPNLVQKVHEFSSDKDFRTLIPTYFEAEVIGVRSPLTVKAKREDLKKFLLHYESLNGHLRANEWMSRDTRAFSDELVRQGYRPSSMNRCLATLRSLGSWLLEAGIVKQHPCRGIRDFALEPLRPKSIKELEFHRLRKAADVLTSQKATQHSQDFRNKVILEVLNASGLRISELLNLRLPQLQGKKLVNVICKGSRVRDILITQDAAELINEYIHNHRKGGSDFVFTNKYGKHLSRNGAAGGLSKIAGYANVSLPENQRIHLTPHRMRHFHGYKARATKDDTFAQKRLGHASGKYIERYTGLDETEEESLLAKM